MLSFDAARGTSTHKPNAMTISSPTPYEQLNITKDLTPYLWYETTIVWSDPSTNTAQLLVDTMKANSLIIFLDGLYQACTDDHLHDEGGITLNVTLKLSAGTHTLQILSVSLGLNNGMNPGDGNINKIKGIVGRVILGSSDITSNNWRMSPALTGWLLQIFTEAGSKNVKWSSEWEQAGPLTWYQTTFPTSPLHNDPSVLLLDLSGMNRGYIYVNGHNLGQYWLLEGGNSGSPTQRYYHLPSDWLAPTGSSNLLTLCEELLAPAPDQVRVAVSFMTR